MFRVNTNCFFFQGTNTKLVGSLLSHALLAKAGMRYRPIVGHSLEGFWTEPALLLLGCGSSGNGLRCGAGRDVCFTYYTNIKKNRITIQLFSSE
jgi:hypothetical protein